MADDYWEHPARRETKRLIDLADAGAILDELQNQTTEWDDAREALDHLVRGPRAEVERDRARTVAASAEKTLGEQIDRAIAAEAEQDRLAEQVKRVRLCWKSARRGRARARAELAETAHALEVTGEKVTALRKQRDQAEAERDQARAELAKRPKSRLGEQVNRLSNAVGDLERERDAARAERDEAREQVTRVREVVASTSWEHALVKARDIRRALDGTEPGQ